MTLFKCFKKLEGKESLDIPKILMVKKSFTDFELDVMELVNYHRREKGLTMLKFNPKLSNVAFMHTQYMSFKGKASHDNFPIRNAQAVKYCKATWMGEVVGYGYSSAEGFVKAWINSPTHKKIIESEKAKGFAISIEAVKNRNYATLLLIDK